MTSILGSFEKILAEFAELQKPGAFGNSFPGLIPTGSEGSVMVNTVIDREIRVVADWLLDQSPSAKRQYRLKEWRTAVRNAFGPALLQLELDAPVTDNARELKRQVEASIDATPGTIPSLLTSLGCSLLETPLTETLPIGPVFFEPKSAWLARTAQTGQITSRTRKRLERAFAGHRLRKSSNAQQRRIERTILDVLQNAQTVCTVETQQLAADLSHARALVGARLGQAAIALLWRMPSTALEHFDLSADRGAREIQTVVHIPGNKYLGGGRWVAAPAGATVPQAKWTEMIRERRGFLDVAGRMIECWTSAPAYDSASPLLRNMAQALLFFWQACRDEDDLMAIVKFTAVLEALSQNTSAGIIKLAKARLGIKDDEKIAGDRNLRQVVDWIYSKGRSRTLHGSNPNILHDWSDARSVAESLTRHCLVACMHWFEKNPTESDPKKLLA